MDATYFENFCLICYQDNQDGYTQLIRFTDSEKYEEMREVLLLLLIKTQNDKIYWINLLGLRYTKHKEYINEKIFNIDTGRYRYTHKLLRKSYFTIKRALSNMFHYLVNPNIPKTTKGIEGFFSHLKKPLGYTLRFNN